MRLPVIQGKWSWPAAWSWGSGAHRAGMRREGSTAGTRKCRKQGRQSEGYTGSSCSSLRCRWWAPQGSLEGTGPSPESGSGEEPVCWKQKDHSICPYSLVAPGTRCRKCLRGIVSRIFPGAPSECEGIQTSGPGLALAARLPHTLPRPCLFAPLLTNICSAGYTALGWQSRWNAGSAYPQDTHSPRPSGHELLCAGQFLSCGCCNK